jgi:nucleoside-diphosphate-sugar epimerase
MALHVVVTGAGGFVGGFVARWLAVREYEVTAVTRRPVQTGSKRIHWLTADLREPAVLPRRIDALLHCAAETPEHCPDPDQLYRGNVDMARNVFEQALAAGARSVVFLSSMAVYGDVSVPVVTEDLLPNNPSPYGRAKRDSEVLLEACVRGGVYSGLVIRLPGTVGKGSHDNFLSTALARILRGETVQARNPDALFNNIVYVGHLAEFLGQWIVRPTAGYAATNLGATDPLPFREVFDLLFAYARKERKIIFAKEGKPPFLIALDQAISLGYNPSSVRISIEAFVRDNIPK